MFFRLFLVQAEDVVRVSRGDLMYFYTPFLAVVRRDAEEVYCTDTDKIA